MALFSLVLLLGMGGLATLGGKLDQVEEVGVKSSVLLGKLEVEFLRLRMRHYRWQTAEGADAKAALVKDLRTSWVEVKGLLKEVQSSEASRAFPQEVEAAAQAIAAYEKVDQGFLSLAEEGKVQDAVEVMAESLRPLAKDKVEPAIASLLARGEKESTLVQDEAHQTLHWNLWLTGVLGLAAALVGILVAWRITADVSRRTAAMVRGIHGIQNEGLEPIRGALVQAAAKDLSVQVESRPPSVEVRGEDEIAEVGLALNQMGDSATSASEALSHALASLHEVLLVTAERSLEVAQSSGQLADGARSSMRSGARVEENMRGVATAVEQMGSTSQEIAAGSEKLAASAQEAASLMNSLEEAVDQGMAAAQGQSEGALEAQTRALEGSQALERVAQALEEIGQAVEATRTSIAALGDQQDKIQAIVAAIDSIAKQTNLLALNAAIEAARAGVHGQGFAVVAEEVRKLAEDASRSTREIAARIQEVREGIGAAVAGVDQSVQAVARSREEGSSAKSVMESLGTSAQASVDLAQRGVDQLNRVGTLARDMQGVIHQVAAVSQESAAGAEELNATAEEITASVQDVAASTEQQARLLYEASERADRLMASADGLFLRISAFSFGRASDIKIQCAGFKKAHENWVRRVDAMVHDGKEIDPQTLTSHHECALGKWYEASGKDLAGRMPEYLQLEAPHAKVHELAREAVRRHQEKDRQGAESALSGLRVASGEVVTLLDQLESACQKEMARAA